MRRKFFGFGAAFIALGTQPAAAATQDFCFTRTETRMALSYFAPLLVEGFVKSCTPHLTAEAPLLLKGPEMAASYRAVANPTDVDMAALFAKLGGVTGDTPPAMSMDTIANELFADMAKDIKADECVIADKLVDDLAALPAVNMIGLVETGMIMAELKDRQKKAKRTKKPIAPSIFCEG
ncbi:MAG: hypothetical protein ABL928_14610 [Sphingorhabdus sp.]